MSEKTLVDGASSIKVRKNRKGSFALLVERLIPQVIINGFWRLDKRYNGSISFFFRHYGKTRFMVAMSKKVQYHGIEKVYLTDTKGFYAFFFLYLFRDVFLYIALPIYLARIFLS